MNNTRTRWVNGQNGLEKILEEYRDGNWVKIGTADMHSPVGRPRREQYNRESGTTCIQEYRDGMWHDLRGNNRGDNGGAGN